MKNNKQIMKVCSKAMWISLLSISLFTTIASIVSFFNFPFSGFIEQVFLVMSNIFIGIFASAIVLWGSSAVTYYCVKNKELDKLIFYIHNIGKMFNNITFEGDFNYIDKIDFFAFEKDLIEKKGYTEKKAKKEAKKEKERFYNQLYPIAVSLFTEYSNIANLSLIEFNSIFYDLDFFVNNDKQKQSLNFNLFNYINERVFAIKKSLEEISKYKGNKNSMEYKKLFCDKIKACQDIIYRETKETDVKKIIDDFHAATCEVSICFSSESIYENSILNHLKEMIEDVTKLRKLTIKEDAKSQIEIQKIKRKKGEAKNGTKKLSTKKQSN